MKKILKTDFKHDDVKYHINYVAPTDDRVICETYLTNNDEFWYDHSENINHLYYFSTDTESDKMKNSFFSNVNHIIKNKYKIVSQKLDDTIDDIVI